MYGDSHYELFASGSTAASGNDPHLLFGAFDGLSTLNQKDVVHIFLESGDNDMRVGLPGSVSNNLGVPVYTDSFGYDWPPTKVEDARNLHFANKTLGSNAIPSWNIFRRIA